MKIIQQGNLEVLKNTKQFNCIHCGCKFEADKSEYRLSDYWAEVYVGISASCKCPCCGETAYSNN